MLSKLTKFLTCLAVLTLGFGLSARATTLTTTPDTLGCSFGGSEGCFKLPNDFTVFILEFGDPVESVDSRFELAYIGGGAAAYAATINPLDSFSGQFQFGPVDVAASTIANNVVLTGAAIVLSPGSTHILNFAAGVLYGITVIGSFVGAGNFASYDISLNSAVPLPPALLLFGSALGGLIYLTRRRRSTGPGLAV
jgi:hypothetical protein